MIEVVLIGIGLSMDAFAVAIVASTLLVTVSARQFFRLSFHFGLFQAMMPVLGWLAGQTMADWIKAWDHWIVFGILLGIGGKMAYEAVKESEEDASGGETGFTDPTKGLKLVALSLATSVDAMAVGLTFAMLNINIAFPVIAIGCITAALTFIGMKLGSRLGLRFGKKIQVLGGCVLAGIGLKILLQHLLA